MIEDKKKELSSAIQSAESLFALLRAGGFIVIKGDDGQSISLFKRLKNGNLRKTPSFYVFFMIF